MVSVLSVCMYVCVNAAGGSKKHAKRLTLTLSPEDVEKVGR
jgi:hypothetical protein